MSQQERKVVVASPASNQAKQYETDVTTWGELKEVISELLTGNVEAIVKPGNVTLTRDDAALPTGDFRVYLIPTKNKAGMSPTQAQNLGNEISTAIVAAAARAQENDLNQLKEDLVEVIEDFFGVSLETDCPECAEALADARRYMA